MLRAKTENFSSTGFIGDDFLPVSVRWERLEPVVGIEPTTDGLQNRCSTTELNWLDGMKIKRLRLSFKEHAFHHATTKCRIAQLS